MAFVRNVCLHPCWLFLLCASVSAGCSGSGLPTTHPGKGKVIYKGGDVRLLEGGRVELQSVADPSLIAGADIEADGGFSLQTWSKDGRAVAEGVAAGEHRARVVPPRPAEPESRDLIDAKYQNFEKSGLKVTIPSDKLEFTVARRPR